MVSRSIKIFGEIFKNQYTQTKINMKKITIFLSFICFAVNSFSQNGLDSVIVEKYYISNSADVVGSIGALPQGSITYRIFVDMKPGYKFQALYGINTPIHKLLLTTSTSFFNNEDRGATTPNGITLSNTKKNSVMIDSWFSVGATAVGKIGVLKTEDTDGSIGNTTTPNPILQNTDPLAGIPINAGGTPEDGMVAGTPEAVTFVGLTKELDVFDATSQANDTFFTSNGSIAALNGAVGPTALNRVLLGQFTTDGTFCYELNIQIGTPTGGVENYVAKNPMGSEVQLPSLMGCIAPTITDVKNETAPYALHFKTYPNPASDILFVELPASKNSTENSYTVYAVGGRIVFHKTLGMVAEKQAERIDMSSFSNGMYIIQISIDGVISHKPIIKN